MNKFYQWLESQGIKQRHAAQVLGISTSTMHEILRLGKLPSLKVAYEIEKYTKGAVTLYDWFDHEIDKPRKKKEDEKVQS